ncbi:MAG: hypothetical protein ACJ76H_06750 [Bacteriovoracaceae bacterium]
MKLKNNNSSILTGGVLLLLSFPTFAGNFFGKIEGFKLSTCESTHCFRLDSPLAHVSQLDGNYAFDEASLTIQDKTLVSTDVYYDRRLHKVFMRNVNGTEFVYNVASGELTRFGN